MFNLTLMADCSRNGVLNLEFLQKNIPLFARLNIKKLQLYTEDTYIIEDEPLFSHLRGGYTREEIKKIEGLCKSHGIELVPCIQTLAHLPAIFKWPRFKKIRDCNDILLVDNEETYEFIDKMFSSIAKSFESRSINIGMDEAHFLGLGQYRKINGLKDRLEILQRHLARVCAIAQRYDFKPMMWSDMFFRLLKGGEYSIDNVSEMKIDDIPNVDLIYWDYSSASFEHYERMFKAHKQLNKNIIFAGGAWRWTGFAPNNRYSLNNTRQALKAARENNVNDIIVTSWADDGAECPILSSLPSIAYFGFCSGGGDENDIKGFESFFKQAVGADVNDFIMLDKLNDIEGDTDGLSITNPSKYMLYNDPLLGVADCYEKPFHRESYLEFSKKMDEIASRISKDYKYLFERLKALADFLSIKTGLCLELRDAYKNNVSLEPYINVVKNAKKALRKFIKVWSRCWELENKPFGREIIDVRLGGLHERYSVLENKLKAYLAKKITSIPELESEIKPFNEEIKDGQVFLLSYEEIASAATKFKD